MSARAAASSEPKHNESLLFSMDGVTHALCSCVVTVGRRPSIHISGDPSIENKGLSLCLGSELAATRADTHVAAKLFRFPLFMSTDGLRFLCGNLKVDCRHAVHPFSESHYLCPQVDCDFYVVI